MVFRIELGRNNFEPPFDRTMLSPKLESRVNKSIESVADQSSRIVFWRRLVAMYCFAVAFVMLTILTRDFAADGGIHFTTEQRVKLCAIAAGGPLSILFLHGMTAAGGVILTGALGGLVYLSHRWRHRLLARLLGYVAVLVWVLLGQGLALLAV